MKFSLKKFLTQPRSWIFALTLAVGIGCAISTANSANPTIHQILSTPENVIWGELFKPNSPPILKVKLGDRVGYFFPL